MIEVVPYMDGDLDDLDMLHNEHIATQDWLVKGPSVTLLCDGQIIACGGVVILTEGVGTAWIAIDKRVKGQFALVRAVVETSRNLFETAFRDYGLRRIQASSILGDDISSTKWLERLGFVREGIMLHYGPNGEMAGLYARYR